MSIAISPVKSTTAVSQTTQTTQATKNAKAPSQTFAIPNDTVALSQTAKQAPAATPPKARRTAN